MRWLAEAVTRLKYQLNCISLIHFTSLYLEFPEAFHPIISFHSYASLLIAASMSTDTAEIEAILSSFVDTDTRAMAQPLPEAIIFGNNATGTMVCDLISKDLLTELPKTVMDQIIAGNALGKPTVPLDANGGVLMLGATNQYELLIRLKKYLGSKSYPPLPENLQIITPDGSRVWTPREHSTALKVTPETAWMLRREMDVYLFAFETGYIELREYSAQRLASGYYPKSLEGIVLLVLRVYDKSVKAGDLQLANKIVELLNANSQNLRQVKEYVSTVKQIFRSILKNQDDVRQILLQPVIDSFEASTVKPEGSDSGSIASPISPTSGLPAPPTQPRCFEAEMLTQFNASITNGEFYMAKNDGYGTLLSEASIQNHECNERNRDFVFKTGEFFFLDTSIRSGSTRNKVFTNSQGQRGTVMVDCVLKVKPGLDHTRASAGLGRISCPSGNRRALVDRFYRHRVPRL